MKTIRRNEVWMCDLPKTGNCVQCGLRPCIIVSNDIGNTYSPTILVIPLTTKNKNIKQPTHCFVMPQDNLKIKKSMALCEQIIIVDRNICRYSLGRLDLVQIAKINKCIESALNI